MAVYVTRLPHGFVTESVPWKTYGMLTEWARKLSTDAIGEQ